MKFLTFSEDNQLLAQMITFLRSRGEVDAATSSDKDMPIEYGADVVYALRGNAQYDSISAALKNLFKSSGYDAIVIASTVLGREVAGHLSVGIDSDVAPELSSLEFKDGKAITKRWGYGGKTVIEETWNARVFTLLPGITDAEKNGSESTLKDIQLGDSRVEIISEEPKNLGGGNLESAKIIVSVGRGLGKKEGIEVAQKLADAVGGEIAGSRPVCLDYQWLSEDRQVGLSGKKVKPKVYIALGISGQIQHIAGMRGSKIVIAINKDKSAPIFEESDYGIVGDLYQVTPKLTEKLTG